MASLCPDETPHLEHNKNVTTHQPFADVEGALEEAEAAGGVVAAGVLVLRFELDGGVIAALLVRLGAPDNQMSDSQSAGGVST